MASSNRENERLLRIFTAFLRPRMDYCSVRDRTTSGKRSQREKMVLRTIIADDHPVVLMGTRAALEASGDIEVVAEAASGDELLELVATHPCDVVVTDFSMPGGRHGDGLCLLDLLQRRYPRLPIVVLTMLSNLAVLQT